MHSEALRRHAWQRQRRAAAVGSRAGVGGGAELFLRERQRCNSEALVSSKARRCYGGTQLQLQWRRTSHSSSGIRGKKWGESASLGESASPQSSRVAGRERS